MTKASISRSTILATTLAIGLAYAQHLPPTAPTTLPAANTLPAPIAATPAPAAPRRAEVSYAAGLLDVRADNSSLNQILRTIARLTGMTITGGVADQRVFGNYGPATPGTILATLLDGTGSNMLLRESSTPGMTSELVLTPRNGGPTPPSPDSAMYAEAPDMLTQPGTSLSRPVPQPPHPQTTAPTTPPSIPQPLNNVNGSPSNTDPTASTYPTTGSVPINTVATPSTTPSVAGIVDSPNPPPPGSTTSPNPTGVATPEQVYQQLKALQRAQQQQATTPTTTHQ